jgi:hypothetical protein
MKLNIWAKIGEGIKNFYIDLISQHIKESE